MRQVMDDLTPGSPYTEVVLCKGVQIAGTEVGNNFIGYAIDYVPGPMLLVMPTVELAKRNSDTRIEPMIGASPRLREKVPVARSRDSQNKQLQKQFPGGIMIMTGANSAASLRSMPARYLMLDEVDAYPLDADEEGSPILLAEARTATFGKRRKIFKVSTPKVESTSVIWPAFLASDQNYYHVPCPYCSTHQKIEWERIKWEVDRPETAALRCLHCERMIEEYHKEDMLARGRWIAENPGSKIRGYHISSLYSPLGWMSWETIVKEFIAAGKDRGKLQVWINTKLGLPWVDKGESPDKEKLIDRRENYAPGTVPAPAVVLTAGVDIQRDRIEVGVWAWAEGMESWAVDHIVIPGDTGGDKVFSDLDEVLGRDFRSEYGVQMKIRMAAIDTAYQTMRVYEYVRNRPLDRFMAVRGSDVLPVPVGVPRAVDVKLTGRTIQNGVRLWPVGVSLLKSELYGWLRQKKTESSEKMPPGWVHFPMFDTEWFNQLTAEELKITATPKGTKYEWLKAYDRNEVLDCRNYARAAASVLGVAQWSAEYFTQLRMALSLGDSSAPADGETIIVRKKGGYLD